MNRFKKTTGALLLMGTLLASSFLPVFAQSFPQKEENVYINLDTQGSVTGIYVVNAFSLEDATSITDYGNYENVRSLSDNDVVQSGDTITAQGEKGTFYYQGNLSSSTPLPWKISFSYFLDGQRIDPAQLGGKSGHLRLEGSVQQNLSFTGDSYFDHFMVQIELTLSNEVCHNLSAPDATIANVGSNKQLTYMVLPGNGLDFTVEADVENFTMDGISLNALPLSLAIEKPDTQELDQDLGKLENGVKDLDKGAQELTQGSQELKSGATNLTTGVEAVKAGAQKVAEGTQSLKEGAQKLTDGLSILAGQSRALNEGAKQIFDSLLSAANTQITAALAGTELSLSAPLTAQNYQTVLNTLLQDIGGVALKIATQEARQQVTQEVTATVEKQITQEATATVRAQVAQQLEPYRATIRTNVEQTVSEQIKVNLSENQLLAVALQMAIAQNPNLGSASVQEQQAAAQNLLRVQRAQVVATAVSQAMSQEEWQTQIDEQVQAELDKQIDAQMQDSSVQQAITQAVQTQMQSEKIQGLIALNIETSLSSPEVQKKIADAVAQATGNDNAYVQQINTLATQLTGFSSFYNGLLAYTDGVDQAASGAKNLLNGATELQRGVNDLNTGINTLKDGSHALLAGIETLTDGIHTLKEGTGELRNKTQNMDGQVQEQINKLLEQFKNEGYVPKSFVSEKNTAVRSLQFVMKTQAISLPEEPEPVPEESRHESFWDKIVVLFTW